MKQHSTKDFDFDRPDKRMPYTVPDGFFTDLEAKILAATVGTENKTEAPTAKRSGRLRRPILRRGTPHRWFVAGAAACVAVAALTALELLPRRYDPQPVTYAEVEQVFTQLTDKEQAELLDLYQNDPFLNL